MIIHDTFNFNIEQDPIKTERSVFEKISHLNLPYEYVAIPIAFCINRFGLKKTQSIIDDIQRKYLNKKIFVCQHIYVNKLNFYNNFIFTPHTLLSDNYQVIPHYNSIFDECPIIKTTNLLCNFVGDFNTNSIRKKLVMFESSNIIIQNTNGWFFQKKIDEQNELKQKYKDIIQSSYFSFCPEGTGPSTLRLYECISAGSFPIIFNDVKIPKLLENFVIRTNIDTINFIELKKKYTENMRKEMQTIYWENYSNKNLYKTIELFFKENHV